MKDEEMNSQRDKRKTLFAGGLGTNAADKTLQSHHVYGEGRTPKRCSRLSYILSRRNFAEQTRPPLSSPEPGMQAFNPKYIQPWPGMQGVAPGGRSGETSPIALTKTQEERWGESGRLLRTWAPVGTARPAGQGRGTWCPRGAHHPATHIPKRISKPDPRPTASPDPDPAARSPGAATRGRSRPRSSSASAAQRAKVRPTRAGTVPESSARVKAARQNLPHGPGGAEPAEDSKRLGTLPGSPNGEEMKLFLLLCSESYGAPFPLLAGRSGRSPRGTKCNPFPAQKGVGLDSQPPPLVLSGASELGRSVERDGGGSEPNLETPCEVLVDNQDT
ncbi:hypothetical protein H8959_005263 [Pygathrix nigripes]